VADVICAGVHVLDVLGGPVAEMPTTARAALVEEITISVAGTAGGVAVDLARFGVDVATIGVVGDDVAGRLLGQMMREHGVDVSGLRVDREQQTSMSMHAIGADGERRPIHVVGANRSVRPEDVVGVAASGARAVHLGGLDVLPALWPVAVELLSAWRDAGLVTTLDLLGRNVTATDIDWPRVLGHVTWFLPNESQLLALSGGSDPRDAVTWALERGARHVVMTLGADGCLVGSADGLVHIPARAVEVRDTTGCGDAVVAGLLAGLLDGLDDVAAVELGVVAGSLTARRFGSDAGAQTLDELREARDALPIVRPTRVLGDLSTQR
jgi:sugar/nucleoside kinase (ribokinase family)